jgi:ankyrin repeat protein
MVKLLVDAAQSTSFVDSEGRSPLHIAVQSGQLNIVRMLVDMPRFDANAQDCDGNSPLHLAVLHQHTALVELLLGTTGINMELKDHSGQTALHLAVLHEQDEIVRMLLEQGADLTAQIG